MLRISYAYPTKPKRTQNARDNNASACEDFKYPTHIKLISLLSKTKKT